MNCTYIIAATLYTLETWLVAGMIVNTLQTGGGGGGGGGGSSSSSNVSWHNVHKIKCTMCRFTIHPILLGMH
jgi:hypothetical protein